MDDYLADRDELIQEIEENDIRYKHSDWSSASNINLKMIREMSLLRKELYQKIDEAPEEDFNKLDEEYLGKLNELFKEYGYNQEEK